MAQLNSLWIDLHSRSDDLFIDKHHRPYNKFQKLRFPDEQAPQMIMLIGDRWKTEVMNHLQPSLKSAGSHNGIHLHLLAGETAGVNIIKDKVKSLFCRQVKRNTNASIDTAVTHKAVLLHRNRTPGRWIPAENLLAFRAHLLGYRRGFIPCIPGG